RRELAGLGAAHAVGDREERRRDDVLVLVSPALLAGVRAVADLHDSTQVSYLNSVSPPRRRLRRRPGGRSGSAAAAVQTRLLGAVKSRTSIPSRHRGVACAADLEAVAALPLRPSKHGSSVPSRLVPQFRLASEASLATPTWRPWRLCRCGRPNTAPRCRHVSYLNSVSPTRTTSPGVSLRARVSLIPFR